MKTVVTVFGATGQQGGSVVRALLEQPETFHIRAVTRNPTSPKALSLQAAGCELVQAELAQTESLIPILQGADCCFLVTLPPERVVKAQAADEEFQYGTNVANACMAVGLRHLIFTTLPYCEKITGAPVPWSDSKARITEYFKEKRLPLTAITIPDFYENYLTVHRPKQVGDGIYHMEIPTGEQPFGLINISYLGEAVRHFISHREEYVRRDVTLVTDRLTVGQIAHIMNKHLAPLGKTVGNARFTLEWAREKYKDYPGVETLFNWYKFILAGPADPQYDEYKNIEMGRRLMPSAKSFDGWIQENRKALAAALV